MSDQVRQQGVPQAKVKRAAPTRAATAITAAAAAIAAPVAGKTPAPAPAQLPAPASGKAPAQTTTAKVTIRGTRPADLIEPVRAKTQASGTWTEYLVLFLRVMAAVSLVKGLYHWSQICSIGATPEQVFEVQSMAWRSVTVFFAVIDLVAAVGLWLAAPWGAVVWLTSTVSMAMVELFFPGVYGGSAFVVLTEVGLLGVYLWLAIISARERPA
jgi:uncharacterized protein DUF6163